MSKKTTRVDETALGWKEEKIENREKQESMKKKRGDIQKSHMGTGREMKKGCQGAQMLQEPWLWQGEQYDRGVSVQEADWRDRMKTPTRNHCIKQSKTEALQGILRHHAQLLAHLWKNPCFIKKITFYNFSLMISSVYTVYLDHLYPTLPSLHLPFCSPMCNHPPDQRATHQWPHS